MKNHENSQKLGGESDKPEETKHHQPPAVANTDQQTQRIPTEPPPPLNSSTKNEPSVVELLEGGKKLIGLVSFYVLLLANVYSYGNILFEALGIDYPPRGRVGYLAAFYGMLTTLVGAVPVCIHLIRRRNSHRSQRSTTPNSFSSQSWITNFVEESFGAKKFSEVNWLHTASRLALVFSERVLKITNRISS